MTIEGRPDISVIVPVYNAAPYLRQCLDSILSQKVASLEVITVDDGSTDGSWDICREYEGRDPRLRALRIPHAGSFPARNRGLDEARGEFLAFVDADDYLEPDAYESLLRAQRETGADVTQGMITVINPLKPMQSYLGGTDFALLPTKGIIYIEDEAGRPALHFYSGATTFLVRRDLIQRHSIRFREDLLSTGDGRFVLRLSEVPHVYHFLEKSVYIYRRQLDNSITSTYSATKLLRARNAMDFLAATRRRLERDYEPARIDAVLGDPYVSFMIRYLVVCGADSLAGRDSYPDFRAAFGEKEFLRLLPHYNPKKAKGRSWLLPWLARFGLARPAFLLCRRKARLRYGRELAAIAREREGNGKN